jgi:ribosomal protein S14
MKEIFEFRVNNELSSRLFDPSEGESVGHLSRSVKVIRISKDDPRFDRIPVVDSEIRNEFKRPFYYSWRILREYSKVELSNAYAFNVKVKHIFEPTGEECGTIYNEDNTCEVCGSGREQTSALRLKKGSIPRKDISCTIGGEVIVSERFKNTFLINKLKGVKFEPVFFENSLSNSFQLFVDSPELHLTNETIAGIDPFDLSESEGQEIYKCPKGHTIGLNLLSELHLANDTSINKFDFFKTKQKTGVKRGLLRPQPFYICSRAFREMVLVNKLSGFDFEIARVE